MIGQCANTGSTAPSARRSRRWRRRVGEVILAAHDVRDREIAVVDGGREVERRPPVRAHEHEVGDLVAGEAHRPARRVVHDDLSARRTRKPDDIRLAGVVALLGLGARERAGSARRSAPATAGRSSGRRASCVTPAQRRRAARGARSGAPARRRVSQARRGHQGCPAPRPATSSPRRCRRRAAIAHLGARARRGALATATTARPRCGRAGRRPGAKEAEAGGDIHTRRSRIRAGARVSGNQPSHRRRRTCVHIARLPRARRWQNKR